MATPKKIVLTSDEVSEKLREMLDEIEALTKEYEELIGALDFDHGTQLDKHSEVVDAVKTLNARADAWRQICRDNDLDPDNVYTDDLIEKLDETSPLVEELREQQRMLLDILDLTEHEWLTMSYSDRQALKAQVRRA